MRGARAVVAALVVGVSVVGCGAGGGSSSDPGRSGAASAETYCRLFVDEILAFNAAAAEAEGLQALLALAATPSRLVEMFESLEAVAPDAVAADTALVAETFRTISESQEGDPVAAIVGGLAASARGGPALARIDEWVTANCGAELERLERAAAEATTTTAPEPAGEVLFDGEVDCANGREYRSSGEPATITARFSEIRAVATVIHVVAKDARAVQVGETWIESMEMDGSGGEGELTFSVPAGGWNLGWDNQENPLSSCAARLTITSVPADDEDVGDADEPTDGDLVAERPLPGPDDCRVDGSHLVAGGLDEDQGLLEVFDAAGELVLSFDEGRLPEGSWTQGRIVGGEDDDGAPYALLTVVHVEEAVGIEPEQLVGQVQLLGPDGASPRWSVDARLGPEPPSDSTDTDALFTPLGVVGGVALGVAGRDLVALEASTGHVAWELPVTSVRDVALLDGILQGRDPNGDQVVLDPATGEVAVRFAGESDNVARLGEDAWISPQWVYDGAGAQLWRLPGGRRTATISSDGSVVMVDASSVPGGVVGHDPATGDVVWEIPADQADAVGLDAAPFGPRVRIADVVLGSTSRDLVVLDVRTGEQLQVLPKAEEPPVGGIHVDGAYLVCRNSSALFFASRREPLAAAGAELIYAP